MAAKKKKGGAPVASSSTSCIAVNVDVSGKPAVWIFSEFETDESLENLRDWLEPDNWPSWGGEMFKEMRPTGPVTEGPLHPGGKQTHANYLEVVEIGGHRLETVLHCDLKSTPAWAAMSYDLDHSIGNLLQVDRGYLMALDVAGRRQVKALKVVGFTDTLLNTFATTVCPEWGTWVQRAVNVATVRAAGGSVDPTPGSVGDPNPEASGAPADSAAFTGGVAEQWVSTVTDMAEFYGQYASDVGARLWSGKYKQQDAAEDSTRLFQRLARDWSRAWQAGMEATANWSEADVQPTAGSNPARTGRTIEHTAMILPTPSTSAKVSISDLHRVGLHGHTIKASSLRVDPPTAGPGVGATHVTVQTDTTDVPCGLYEGELTVGTTDHVPALFYVSNASPAA